MKKTPKSKNEKFKKLVQVLDELRADGSSAGKTLAQIKAALKRSFDLRADIEALLTQLTDNQNQRNTADDA